MNIILLFIPFLLNIVSSTTTSTLFTTPDPTSTQRIDMEAGFVSTDPFFVIIASKSLFSQRALTFDNPDYENPGILKVIRFNKINITHGYVDIPPLDVKPATLTFHFIESKYANW